MLTGIPYQKTPVQNLGVSAFIVHLNKNHNLRPMTAQASIDFYIRSKKVCGIEGVSL